MINALQDLYVVLDDKKRVVGGPCHKTVAHGSAQVAAQNMALASDGRYNQVDDLYYILDDERCIASVYRVISLYHLFTNYNVRAGKE